MKNTKVNAENFSFSSNQLEITLPSSLKNIKIIDAYLKVKLDSNSANNFSIDYLPIKQNLPLEGWSDVDIIKNLDTNQDLTVNISDELQDAINKKAEKIKLSFIGSSNITFSFDSQSAFLNIDYISLSEFQENNVCHTIDGGSKDKLSINLLSKEINLSTSLFESDKNALPLMLTNNYCSSPKSEELNLPKNLLNIQQYLIKHENEDKLFFTYIDASGKEQIIEEKYFYTDTTGKKQVVSRKDIEVDADGQLQYTLKTTDNNGVEVIEKKPVEKTLEAPSGIKLISSLSDLKGSNLVNYEPEELANVRQQIKQLTDQIDNMQSAQKNNNQQIAVYTLTKMMLNKQLENHLEAMPENEKFLEIKRQVSLIQLYLNRKNRNSILKDESNNAIVNVVINQNATAYLDKTYEDNPELTGKDFSTQMISEIYDYYNEAKTKLEFGEPEFASNTVKVIAKTLLNESSDISSLGTINPSGKGEDVLPGFVGTLALEEKSFELEKEIYQTNISRQTLEEAVSQEISEALAENNLTQEDYHIDMPEILDKFTSEKLTLSLRDILSINMQIESLVDTNIRYQKQIEEYSQNLKKLKNQEAKYEMQVPVHYLYDDSNIIYGFGKAEDTKDPKKFRLVLITDAYENAIYITYKNFSSNEIDTITNSAEKMLTFKYSKGLLNSITDENAKKVAFSYDNDKNIIKISRSNGEFTRYIYENDILSAIIDCSGKGVLISGAEDLKIQSISARNDIKSKKFNWDNLSSDTLQQYAITKEFVIIKNNNYKSCSLTNGRGKTVSYLFDKFGKTQAIIEGDYSKHDASVATSFTYEDGKISRKVCLLPYSANYFEGSCFTNESKLENVGNLSLGNTECSSTSIPYMYLTCKNVHSMENLADSSQMSDENIIAINELEICHKVFVASVWAKANSAFIITDEDANKYPDYIKQRKFELRIQVEYANGEMEEQSQCFDWRNTDWQLCSVPVAIKGEVAKITGIIDYSNNTGEIEYRDIEFKEGDFEEVHLDNLKRPIKKLAGHSEWIYAYEYIDDSTKVAKEIITSNKDNSIELITTYEYNPQGKLVKQTDYKGVVKENVYNDKGLVEKTITYHKDNPASKLYEEKLLDDTGKEIGSVNEFGDKVAEYKHRSGTGTVSEETDMHGTKTAYGYADETLIETSTTIDGIDNTNTYGYELGLISSLKHNNFEIVYDYDNECRLTSLTIGGEEYLTKEYEDLQETTKYETGEELTQTYNENGKVIKTYYKETAESDAQLVSENFYDLQGNLLSKQENGKDVVINYLSKMGNVEKQELFQHGKTITIENFYDDNHNKVEEVDINIGDKNLFYSYTYDRSPDARLESVLLPNKLEQFAIYDSLNRVSNIFVGTISKDYTYLKAGDHTSNLVSAISFGTHNTNVQQLRYKYDEKGNITEIRELNTLVARFSYDGLSRLVREDNLRFGKTTLFAYDGGGNILQRREFPFSLADADSLTGGTDFNYTYPAWNWRDQLKSYNGLAFEYDRLGNPTLFKGKALKWGKLRQLERFGVDTDGTAEATYTYNSEGIRTSKTTFGAETKFFLSGTKILSQSDTLGNTFFFHYGLDGITGFELNGTQYLYKKNAQNDVIGIYTKDGVEIARYFYDAWGNQKAQYLADNGNFVDITDEFMYNYTSITNKFVACINPFRYRSYYYDFETGLYYLNSRYYDPEIGRFINADDVSTLDITKITLNGLNLYAYCLNNPVNHVDENGYFISWLIALLLCGLAFAVANTAVQLVSDVVNWAMTGKWTTGWEDYAGAFLGGFLGGITFFLTGYNPQAAFGAMAFGENLFTNLFTNLTGRTETPLIEMFGVSILLGAFNFVIGKGFSMLGITKGANSFLAIFKSGITKLINNTLTGMSLKVFLKGVFGIFILKGAGIIPGLARGILDKIKGLGIFGNKGVLAYAS